MNHVHAGGGRISTWSWHCRAGPRGGVLYLKYLSRCVTLALPGLVPGPGQVVSICWPPSPGRKRSVTRYRSNSRCPASARDLVLKLPSDSESPWLAAPMLSQAAAVPTRLSGAALITIELMSWSTLSQAWVLRSGPVTVIQVMRPCCLPGPVAWPSKCFESPWARGRHRWSPSLKSCRQWHKKYPQFCSIYSRISFLPSFQHQIAIAVIISVWYVDINYWDQVVGCMV